MTERITAEQAAELLSYDPGSGEFRWKIARSYVVKVGQVVGSWDLHGYKTVRLNGRSYKLHRLAWLMTYGVWPAGDVDHINGIRHDNRISNLRDLPRGQNLENRWKPNPNKKSGLPLGVHKAKGGHYSARISVDNKSVILGTFVTVDDATAAYFAAKIRFHQGFARSGG